MVNCDEDEITTFIDVCSAGCTRPATLDLQMNSEADSLYEEACAHYENEEIDSCTYKLTKALELYRESGENEKVAITCLFVGAILTMG